MADPRAEYSVARRAALRAEPRAVLTAAYWVESWADQRAELSVEHSAA